MDTRIRYSHKWILNKKLLKHFLYKWFLLKHYPTSTVYIHTSNTLDKMNQETYVRKSYFLKLRTGAKEHEISFCSVCLFSYLLKMTGVYQSCCSLHSQTEIIEIVGVVKKKWSTMLTGIFEKKWKKNVAWQLRSWSEDLVGFSHYVVTAADCRADGKELDFKQCTFTNWGDCFFTILLENGI